MINHDAVYRAYPEVVSIIQDTPLDANGNQIQIDQALVDAAAIEVATEQAWKSLRTRRNQLLSETDHLALSDQIMTTEMAAYRQALRDLPANTVDPANPIWPVKPNN